MEVYLVRHLTKSDFDGVVCDRILRQSGVAIDSTKFVHATDVVNGKVPILGTDIMTCLPFDVRCTMSFDYHATGRPELTGKHVFNSDSPSCARLVYDYYRDIVTLDERIVNHVDDHCTGKIKNIENPEGWELLGFLMDSRTGLGRWRDFTISNYAFMQKMASYVGELQLDEILSDSDVRERILLLKHQHNSHISQLKHCTKIKDDVAIVDYRSEELIYCGNRFLVYVLFPQVKYVMRVTWGLRRSNIVVMLSKSTTNPTGTVDIPDICRKYGGFANKYAGSFQISVDRSELVLRDIRNLLMR